MRSVKDKHRILLENLPEAFAYHQIVTDSSGIPIDYIFLDLNPAFEKMTGLTRDELTGKKVTESLKEFGHSVIQSWITAFGEVALTGDSTRFEQYIESVGRWYEVKAYSDEHGFFSVLFCDITEVKQTDKSLLENEASQRVLLENIPTMAWYFIDDHTYGTVNNAYAKFIGFKAEDIAFKSMYDFLPANVAADGRAKNRKVFETGEPLHFNVWIPDASGEKRLLSTTKVPKFDNRGRVEHVVCSAEDITERKRIEESLRYQQELLKGIIDGVKDLLRIQHPDHTIEYCNQAAYDILGLDPQEIEGKKCYELIGKNRECRPCAIRKTLIAKKPEKTEKYLPDQEIFLECHSNPVFDDNGNIIRVIEHIKDITEQKKCEQRLKDERDYMLKIFDAMSQFIIITSPNHKIEFLNLAAREYFVEDRLTGEICYKQLGRQSPCSQCPKPFILANTSGESSVFAVEAFDRILEGKASKMVNLDGSSSLLCVLEDVTEHKRAEKMVRERELWYRQIFEESPISLWEEDFSEVKQRINELKRKGIKDFRSYFESRPELALQIISLVKIINANQTTLKLYRARSKEDFYSNITEVFSRSSRNHFFDILTAVAEGETELFLEKQHPTLDGETIEVQLHWSVLPGFKETYSRILVSVIDVTERKRAERRMRYLSFHDQLTGLYNRVYLEEEMHRLDTKRQLPISIIMADLNGLKLVNDTYGHETGDKVLKHAGEVLKTSCRSEDIIARWGGDEFVILLPQTDSEKVESICKRIKEKMKGIRVEDIPISVALGKAVKNTPQTDLMVLLKKAEDRMYKNKLTENMSTRSAVLNALLKALEEKSFETEEHIKHMQNIAQKIGQKLKLSDTELKRLELLIKLHDIGKINISEEILTKKGSLTAEEWELMKKHPEIGYRLARATNEFAHVAEEILSHHERWDGYGYPQGLKGEEIPLLARIAAISDAYEVMINRRPYYRPLSEEQISIELRRSSGTHFDPELVEVFLSVLEEEQKKE